MNSKMAELSGLYNKKYTSFQSPEEIYNSNVSFQSLEWCGIKNNFVLKRAFHYKKFLTYMERREKMLINPSPRFHN